MLSSTRPNINHPICRPDGLLIMLNHDHGVAKISQSLKRTNQARIITLMQTNTWLVQNIEHTDQARTNLGRQTDSLCFTTRQCFSSTIESEVFKPNGFEKPKSRIDFLKHLCGYRRITLLKLQFPKETHRSLNRELRDRPNWLLAHRNRQRFRPQPSPFARQTSVTRHVSLNLATHIVRLSCLITTSKVRNHTLILKLENTSTAIRISSLNHERLIGQTIKQDVKNRRVQFFDRSINSELVSICKSIDYMPCHR